MSAPEFVLGSGQVFFARLVNGVLGPERLIQETPSLSYATKVTTKVEKSSDGPIATPAASAPTEVERSGKFTCKDMAAYNLALHALGQTSTITTAVTAVTDDPVGGGVALVADAYYQLGLAARPHVGVRAITNLVLSTGSTDYAIGDDYTVDLATGRIYIPLGSGAAAHIVTADYNTSVATWEQSESGDEPVRGALRFIANNSVGPNKDRYWPAVLLYPDGDVELKSRDKYSELGFAFDIFDPASGAAMYATGRAA